MRYAFSFSAGFAQDHSFRIESDRPIGGMLTCVFGPSGSYLSPTSFGRLQPDEDDKRVISPEEVAPLIFQLAKLDLQPLETRIPAFSNCEVQAEIHLPHPSTAVRIGLQDGQLLVKATDCVSTRISFAELPQFLFATQKRICVA